MLQIAGTNPFFYARYCREVVLVYINCLLLFSLANIAERRVRPCVCVIV